MDNIGGIKLTNNSCDGQWSQRKTPVQYIEKMLQISRRIKMRVAVYVRVSTIRQVQTQSSEQQLERLQVYIGTQGWQLLPVNVFRDEGYSGSQLRRPGLDRLRDKVGAGEFDRIIITDPDRLARNYVHQVLLLEELQRFGCQVDFLERPMAETPHDQLLLQIRGAVAEYERTLITERMRRGRMTKLKAGLLLPWTNTPYGYRIDPQRPRDPSGVRIDEAEAAIVGEIYAWYLEESTTLYGLVRRLEARNIPSPFGRKIWGLATLRGILTNPTYTGQVYAGRMQYHPPKIRRSATHPIGKPHDSASGLAPEEWVAVAKVPAIITQEDFDRVAMKLAKNQSFARRNNKTNEYLLRALVSCGWCEMSCTARQLHTGHRYYVCSAKIKANHLQPEQHCPSRFAPALQLDELVWQDLCTILQNPIQIRVALERAYSGEWLPQALQARRENLRKGEMSLSKQLERLTEAYLAGAIPIDEYQKRRRDLENKHAILEKQIKELAHEAERQIELSTMVHSIDQFCQRIKGGLEAASFEQKRQLMELLVDRVIVKDEQVEIRYVVPTNSKSENIRFCHLRSDYRHNLYPATARLHLFSGHLRLVFQICAGLGNIKYHGCEFLLINIRSSVKKGNTGNIQF
jgi:site-specific DNA recombinase